MPLGEKFDGKVDKDNPTLIIEGAETDFATFIGGYGFATTGELATGLAGKQNIGNYATQIQLDSKVTKPADFGDTTLDAYIATKAPAQDLSSLVEKPADFGTNTLDTYIGVKAPVQDLSTLVSKPSDWNTAVDGVADPSLKQYIEAQSTSVDTTNLVEKPPDWSTLINGNSDPNLGEYVNRLAMSVHDSLAFSTLPLVPKVSALEEVVSIVYPYKYSAGVNGVIISVVGMGDIPLGDITGNFASYEEVLDAFANKVSTGFGYFGISLNTLQIVNSTGKNYVVTVNDDNFTVHMESSGIDDTSVQVVVIVNDTTTAPFTSGINYTIFGLEQQNYTSPNAVFTSLPDSVTRVTFTFPFNAISTANKNEAISNFVSQRIASQSSRVKIYPPVPFDATNSYANTAVAPENELTNATMKYNAYGNGMYRIRISSANTYSLPSKLLNEGANVQPETDLNTVFHLNKSSGSRWFVVTLPVKIKMSSYRLTAPNMSYYLTDGYHKAMCRDFSLFARVNNFFLIDKEISRDATINFSDDTDPNNPYPIMNVISGWEQDQFPDDFALIDRRRNEYFMSSDTREFFVDKYFGTPLAGSYTNANNYDGEEYFNEFLFYVDRIYDETETYFMLKEFSIFGLEEGDQ